MKVTLALCFALVGIVCSINPEEGNLFEGDMELNPEQMNAVIEQRGNQFASIRTGLWKSGSRADTIRYYIDPAISGASSAISQAIADYQRYTCIRFSKQSRKPSGSHLFFTTGSGCSSPVGKGRSGNSIKLARGCWRKGTIIHEIGHSLGMFHEQSRPDRDNYVIIDYANIVDRAKFNFNKLTTSRIDSRGTPYDFDSIMHYGGTYFTKNGRPTIRTKNSSYQRRIGQRSGFSTIDKQQLNKMYC